MFEAYVTNLGLYPERGAGAGEYLKFPTTVEEVQALFSRIGIDEKQYEEYFITDYDSDILGLTDHLGEYESLDELNYLAHLLEEMTPDELEKLEAVMDAGEYTNSVKDLINLTQNLDCFDFYSDVNSEEELGRMYIQDFEAIVALAFSQMFNLLCERADNKYGGRLPHHVRVLWDEAANTGQVPGLEKIVAVIRSREISLTLFYQAMSQCKALYKDHAETIMGNMDSIVFLGGREASTLKDISENWLGKATISMQTDSRTRGQSESYGLNTQRLGRELLTTSEITTMPGNKCLLQLRGLPPFFSPKYDLKQHPNYRYTAEHDSKRNAFHLERLTSRRLRLKPEEEYTVYEVDTSDEDADILNYDDLDSADDFV